MMFTVVTLRTKSFPINSLIVAHSVASSFVQVQEKTETFDYKTDATNSVS